MEKMTPALSNADRAALEVGESQRPAGGIKTPILTFPPPSRGEGKEGACMCGE